jgi:hypothetical protein
MAIDMTDEMILRMLRNEKSLMLVCCHSLCHVISGRLSHVVILDVEKEYGGKVLFVDVALLSGGKSRIRGGFCDHFGICEYPAVLIFYGGVNITSLAGGLNEDVLVVKNQEVDHQKESIRHLLDNCLDFVETLAAKNNA